MAAKFGYNIRTLANNNFLKSLKTEILENWVLNKSYLVGDIIYSNGSKYIATNNGTSAGTAPDHTSGIVFDGVGGVSWIFAEYLPVDYPFMGNLYSFLGKGGVSNNWSPNPNEPDNPNLSDNESTTILNEMVSLRKITKEDMRFGIKRNIWSASPNRIYSQYDPNKDPYSTEGDNVYTNPFYCVNKDNKIYKCINNKNNSLSLVEPDGSSTELINLTDGYVWKYMGEVNSLDIDNFVTSEFIPVEFKSYSDIRDSSGSSTRQWLVQQAAKNGQISTFEIMGTVGDLIENPVVIIYKDKNASIKEEIPAANAFVPENYHGAVLEQVLVGNPGENYTKDCIAIIREESAPGSGAYINDSTSNNVNKITITNGSITEIRPANNGNGYNAVKIIIVGDGTGATATGTIAGGSISVINVTNGGLDYTWARAYVIPCISTNSGGGAIANAIMAPRNGHGHNMAKELGSNALIFNIKTSNTSIADDYYLFGEESKFRQLGILSDSRELSGGALANSINYIGPGHPKYTDNASPLLKISPSYGEIIYLSNFPPILRASGQQENIKIVIIF